MDLTASDRRPKDDGVMWCGDGDGGA